MHDFVLVNNSLCSNISNTWTWRETLGNTWRLLEILSRFCSTGILFLKIAHPPQKKKKNMVRSLSRSHRVGDSCTIARCTSAYVHKWIFVLVPSKTLDEHSSHHMDPPGFRFFLYHLLIGIPESTTAIRYI